MTSNTAAFIAFSTPIFIIGVGLQLIFALYFEKWTGVKLFYVAGMNSPGYSDMTTIQRIGDSLQHLVDEAEWNLVQELTRLPRVIVSAARSREPHRLTGYVDEIASLYNQFYTRCKGILKNEEDRRLAQLHLGVLTRHVIRVVFELIGVDAPNEMEKRD